MNKILQYTVILILIFPVFSCDEDFVSRDFPSVITLSVTLDKDGGIVFTGKLIPRGSENVDELGFVWQSSDEPLIETGFKANISEKVNTGLFQLKVFTSLNKNLEYYVRAYATIRGITVYGDTWVFQSPEDFLPPELTLKDKTGHVGDTVEITGGLFNKTISKNSVSFNSHAAEVVEVSDSSLLCVVPWTLTAKESILTITCEGIASEITEKFQLVTPLITSFSPDEVQLLDTITITGSGFHVNPEYNIVSFGTMRGTVISSASGTLSVIVPYSPDSPCFITVTVSGQSAISQERIVIIEPDFDYFAPVSARHLDTITISTINIDPEQITGVFFGTFQARITGYSGTIVSVEVPDRIVTESTSVRVTFPGGEHIFPYNFTLLQPSITVVSPDKVTNFSQITLSGNNFNPYASGNKVKLKSVLNGTEYQVTVLNSEYDTIVAIVRDQQAVNNGLPSGAYRVGISTCENTFWWGGTIEITDMWRKLGDFPGGERYKGSGFSINGKGYAGMGTKMHHDLQNDLWEYNPANDTWTRKADMPGEPRILPVTFVNSSAGFVGGGQDYDNSTVQQPYFDFYKYTPSSNSWTKLTDLPVMQKSLFPPSGSIGENAHFAILSQGTIHKYDNLLNSWSPVYNGDGTFNWAPSYFTINGKIYFISGSQTATNGTNSQVWEYDPFTNLMTRKNDFPGLSRYGAFSFTIGDYGYVGGGVHYNTNEPSPQCLYDVYRYDPGSDQWTLIGLFPGGYNKMYCYSFVIGSKAYLIGGLDYCSSTLHSDVWEFFDEQASKGSR